jgi:hypothetical protein
MGRKNLQMNIELRKQSSLQFSVSNNLLSEEKEEVVKLCLILSEVFFLMLRRKSAAMCSDADSTTGTVRSQIRYEFRFVDKRVREPPVRK